MAFRYLQLDEALAILFSTPFMVAILAGPMLGEWVGWRRWIAIGVGFIGVLVVVRPGLGGLQWAALLSFGSAVCYAFYSITTRMLARYDSSETTLFYSNMLGAAIMLPVLPFVWTPPRSVLDGILMVALGAFGAFGHFLLIFGPPPCAGLGAFALHVLPARVGHGRWLPGVRQRAEPLDACGRGHRHRLRPLSPASRAADPAARCPEQPG